MRDKLKFVLPIAIMLLTFLVEYLIVDKTSEITQYLVASVGFGIAGFIISKNAKVIKL